MKAVWYWLVCNFRFKNYFSSVRWFRQPIQLHFFLLALFNESFFSYRLDNIFRHERLVGSIRVGIRRKCNERCNGMLCLSLCNRETNSINRHSSWRHNRLVYFIDDNNCIVRSRRSHQCNTQLFQRLFWYINLCDSNIDSLIFRFIISQCIGRLSQRANHKVYKDSRISITRNVSVFAHILYVVSARRSCRTDRSVETDGLLLTFVVFRRRLSFVAFVNRIIRLIICATSLRRNNCLRFPTFLLERLVFIIWNISFTCIFIFSYIGISVIYL